MDSQFTGQIVAMKFIVKKGKSDKDLQNLRQEIAILQKLRHPNIILMLVSLTVALWWMRYSRVAAVAGLVRDQVGDLRRDRVRAGEALRCCLRALTTYCTQGELFEILEDDKCLPESVVCQVAKQLVRALEYLHANRIYHHVG
jgi:fused-like protein